MSLKAQLAKAKALWKKGKESKPDFDNVVTDGVYVGKLTKAQLGESESSGRLQVAFAAVITGGEFKGEKVNWWSGLKTEQNFMYLQRDIVRLGQSVPEDINDLEDVLKAIEKDKPAIRFRVKTDGEFTNIRILKKLNADETSDTEDAEAAAGEDEVPEDVEVEGEEDAVQKPAGKGKKAEKEVEEEVAEEVEEEVQEEESALEVGTRVAFDFNDEELVGEVVEVDGENEKAVVKSDAGKKYRVKIENLRPAPKAKVKKK